MTGLDAGSWFHINHSPPVSAGRGCKGRIRAGESVCSSWRAQMTLCRFVHRCYRGVELSENPTPLDERAIC